MKLSRHSTVPLLAFVIVSSAAISIGMMTRDSSWGDDFAGYILQAQGIVAGNMQEVVARNLFTIQNSPHTLNPANYPWGFPLMLAPIYAIFGVKILAFKLVLTFSYACFLGAFFLLARSRLTDLESVILTGVLAYNPVMLSEGQGEVLSDIPFTLFSTVALWLMVRRRDRVMGSRDDLLAAIVMGTAIFAAVFVRPNGILLLVPLAATQVSHLRACSHSGAEPRKCLASIAIPYATLVSLYGLQAWIFPSSPIRDVSFSLAPASIWAELRYYFWLPAYFWHQLGWAAPYIFLALLVSHGYSLMVHGKRDLPLHLYTLATFALYVSFPYRQGARYLYPVWPVFLIFAFDGMKAAAMSLGATDRRWASPLVSTIWLALGVVSLGLSVQLAWKNMAANRSIPGLWYGAFSPGSTAMFDFVRHHTPADSVVTFFKARAMRLRTGRDSFETTDCRDLVKADYLVSAKDYGDYEQIAPEALATCKATVNLKLLYDKDGFAVFQVNRAQP